MLQKFLFVGVGGSGGKTLRIVRRELEWRLGRAGYEGRFPRAWQFLQIDVPIVPDGNDPDLPPQLPAGSYLPLAAGNLSYRDLDNEFGGHDAATLAHSVGWRPDPEQVAVPPAFGAGQYRAVGRVVAAVAMGRIVTRVRQAMNALTNVDVSAELEHVASALGVAPKGNPPAPAAIVVSSIAGGAGSGIFLDVCDVLRLAGVNDMWPGQSVAILYTPDVFEELPPTNRAGVNPNALGAVCELLNGYWNAEDPTFDEFALLENGGLPPARVERRGPRYPLLVGKSNGIVSFTSQNDVYRSVGKSLAAWVTSEVVQDAARGYFQGNWVAIAAGLPNHLPLAPGREAPLSSLGFSSLSLGRDRFFRYASERLARLAVERLLRGHWNDDVPEKQRPEAARDELASDNLYSFLDEARLREIGPEHNQVLDAIRGGTEREARRDALQELKTEIVRAVVRNRARQPADLLLKAILRELDDRKHKFLGDQAAADRQRAEAWSLDIQTSVMLAVAKRMAQVGAPVVVTLLEMTREELLKAVIPELNQMIEGFRHLVTTTQQRVHGKFSNFHSGEVMADNPLIGEAVTEGVHSLWAEAEIQMIELTSRLLEDLSKQFLRPLREALVRSIEGLSTEEQGRPDAPSQISQWSRDFVPKRFEPAQNEFLLESVATYPEAFRTKVQETVGVPDVLGAEDQAVRETITGAPDKVSDQSVVTKLQSWVPKEEGLHIAAARPAVFEVTFGAEALKKRAESWVDQPDTSIGNYIRQSLRDYLDPEATDPRRHDQRLQTFRAGFNQVLDTARPLVAIDGPNLLETHGMNAPEFRRIMTVLPFPAAHPAREIASELLLDRGEQQQDIDAFFGDSDEAQIDISTFLAAPKQPNVFASLMSPINAEWAKRRDEWDKGGFWRWRRTRPLPKFIPTSPAVRRDMIRGWFVGRILHQIDLSDYRQRAVRIWSPAEGWMSFPFPVLGPPVRKLQDLLPALLESLPIAIMEASMMGPRALKPYWRLSELGGMPEGEAAYSGFGEELRRWIVDGEAPEGAPRPVVEHAGAKPDGWEDRLGAVSAFLDRYLESYRKLDAEPVTSPRAALRLSRAWELREDLVRTLHELRTMTDNERQAFADEAPG